MKYLFFLREYAGRLISRLFFPKKCVICKAPAVYQPLCHDCRTHYTRELQQSLLSPRCSICGRLLLSEQQVCTQCRKEDALFPAILKSGRDRAFPVFPYLGKRKRLLTVWKIAGDRSLSGLYARWLFTVIQFQYEGVPVVPVPPRKNKMKEKGWDQIEELCRILEGVYGITVLRILERTTVIQQKKLNRQQRLSTVGADYQPLPEKQLKRVLKGRKMPEQVILLDDVVTTGATMQHAVGALRKIGVETVHPLSLFYVP